MFDLIPRRKGEGREMARFREELDTLFNRFFDRDVPFVRGLWKEEAWAPRLDVSENDAAVTVKAELPGCEAEGLDVRLEGRHLTIKGEKKAEKEEKDAHCHRIERTFGFFSRTIELPAEVMPDDVEATYKKGVLTVVLKKAKVDGSKRIKVSSH